MASLAQRIEDFKREEIVNSNGLSFSEYRKTLKPKYWRVWASIALGYAMLILGTISAIHVQSSSPILQWAALFVLPLFFGWWHIYLQNFLHASAHYNLAESRKLNDVLCNIFIGSISGQNIKNYRTIHFTHHRELGTPRDSEHSYFDALTPLFIVQSLTGVRAAKILMSWKKRRADARTEGSKSTVSSILDSQAFVGAGIHVSLLLLAITFHWWIFLVTWFAGLLMVFPCLNSVRQLLEHRDENATSDMDFTKRDHGEVNRMFGSGPIASTLGSAGFNRHLLHHWEPHISYTNLAEIESFLNDSNVAPILARHQTGYIPTFIRLFCWH
jgi:fatty acid desaturase